MIKAALLLLLSTSAFSIIVKDPPAIQYKYSYNVQDPSTGDNKSQEESRHGDVVTGSYSVLDPDGSKRVVKYTADPRNGFKATIETEPYSLPWNLPIGTRIVTPKPIPFNDGYRDNAPLLYTAALESSVRSYHRQKQYVGEKRIYITPEDLIRKHQARNQYYVLNQYF